MATIIRGINREQESHFGLYRTSVGGDEGIIVRRKVGEPADYMHPSSKRLARQREVFAQASQHYSHLTPGQKGLSRHQFAEVEYQLSHGKTDLKLLTGRQLFIAQEVRSLTATQKQIVFPYELCIILVDASSNPLDGELWLYSTVAGEWFDLPKSQICEGNWLFSNVPPGYAPYRVYGEAEDYFDPELPETQAMSEDDIKPYHYHKLYSPISFNPFSQEVHYYRSWHTFTPSQYVGNFWTSHALWTHGYTGELWLGVCLYGDEQYPNKWWGKRTYQISADDADPKYFAPSFGGLTIEPLTKFSYITWLPDWTTDIYWQGVCYPYSG